MFLEKKFCLDKCLILWHSMNSLFWETDSAVSFTCKGCGWYLGSEPIFPQLEIRLGQILHTQSEPGPSVSPNHFPRNTYFPLVGGLGEEKKHSPNCLRIKAGPGFSWPSTDPLRVAVFPQLCNTDAGFYYFFLLWVKRQVSCAYRAGMRP